MSVRERVENETGRAPRASGRIPGSTSTSTLLEHGLADDVRLIVYPVLLGTEKHVLAEGTPPRSFELVRTKAMPSGIILSTFKLAGALKIT
jgi:dihydrofolate reductase